MNKMIQKSAIIFIALFSVTANLAKAESNIEQKSEKLMERARRLSIAILSEALRNPKLKKESINSLRDAAQNLERIDIKLHRNDGGEFLQCQLHPDFLAYYVRNSDQSTIYTCKLLQNKNVKFIAQVLIHEAIHSTGVTDECITTQFTVWAMNYAKKDLVFEDAYMERCKTDGVPIFPEEEVFKY